MTINEIICGDNMTVLRDWPDACVDSVVTDPPYGLSFMAKKWDYDVPSVEQWKEVLRVMKPGAFLLSFGGTRTYHRLVCNIEDAGFEIRDQIQWLFGSGFPKSLNLGEGRGTALKPANEPICLARKPLDGTNVQNVLKYGTGALNIDVCRIEASARPNREVHALRDDVKYTGNSYEGRVDGNSLQSSKAIGTTDQGRWPANVIHDGSEEVVNLFPQSSGQQADVKGTEPSVPAKNTYGEYGRKAMDARGDSGSAARFFYCAKTSREERDMGLRGMQAEQRDDTRKEGRPGSNNPRNRGVQLRANNHPTVKPLALMQYLCRLITPPNGVVLDPWCGSGSTCIAAAKENFNYIGIELDERYAEMSRLRIKAVDAVQQQLF